MCEGYGGGGVSLPHKHSTDLLPLSWPLDFLSHTMSVFIISMLLIDFTIPIL